MSGTELNSWMSGLQIKNDENWGSNKCCQV